MVPEVLALIVVAAGGAHGRCVVAQLSVAAPPPIDSSEPGAQWLNVPALGLQEQQRVSPAGSVCSIKPGKQHRLFCCEQKSRPGATTERRG